MTNNCHLAHKRHRNEGYFTELVHEQMPCVVQLIQSQTHMQLNQEYFVCYTCSVYILCCGPYSFLNVALECALVMLVHSLLKENHIFPKLRIPTTPSKRSRQLVFTKLEHTN